MVVLRAKCIVAGDSTVGKSALVQTFHSDGSHFPKSYTMTEGVEVCVKSVVIPDTSDTVELVIFDSAGKEIFYDHVKKNWDHPSVVCLVFDLSSEPSFHSCSKWLERIRSQKPEIVLPGVLIGNKLDLEQRRTVTPKFPTEFASSHGLEYFECSAKEQQNVEAPFYYLAQEFYKMYQMKAEAITSLSM
ncbi:IFT27 [Branchiostoma lanceolatum]|uniref:IFT27 protein n=1 Tax=Branchiostoma lanceolatum TaxID=7740 RepID=A0A8K0A6P3_BRALA|nr:IFT27 [Branchiostoma lanceolatum]